MTFCDEKLIKVVTAAFPGKRFLIKEIASGGFTVRFQFRKGGVWSKEGPVLGYYDTVETAESEGCAQALATWQGDASN